MLDPALEPDFTNATFHANSADSDGGAIYLLGWEFSGSEILTAQIDNALLFGNSAGGSGPEIAQAAATTVRSSLVAGSGGSGAWDVTLGTDGGGNLDANPSFVDASNPFGPDGVLGTADDGLALAAGSIAIDAGDGGVPGLVGLLTDITGAPRVAGLGPDLGAYEASGLGSGCGALPGALVATDVGNTGGFSGTTCFSAGTYEVEASGANLWFRQDGFHFVSQPGAFNEVVARVDAVNGVTPFDVAGVMLRASLSPNSAYAALVISEAGAITLRSRWRSGALTGFRFGGTAAGPTWLRLRRLGPFITGAWSSDGSSWHPVGTAFAFLPAHLEAGLATSTLVPGTPSQSVLSELRFDGAPP